MSQKNYVVIGGSHGIGLGLVKELVASGDNNNVSFTTTVDDGVSTQSQGAAHTSNGLHYHVYDIEAGNDDVVVSEIDRSAFRVNQPRDSKASPNEARTYVDSLMSTEPLR